MWYAEKIELTKNSEDKFADRYLDLKDRLTLRINDEYIYNAVTNTLPDYFETCICTECGQEGCNGAPMLQIRKQNDKLLFLPDFDCLDSLEEYNYKTCEGERGCPPHKWYQDGILVVEGDQLKSLYEMLPNLSKEKIKEVSKEELDKIDEWERLVKEKPAKGFMSEFVI